MRCLGSPTDVDVARFFADSKAALDDCMAQLNRPCIGCADLRAVTTFRPEVAQKLADLLKRDNPSVERTAIIITKSATVALQLTRLLRESTSESRRRLFSDTEPLCGWLDELLDAPERARLRQFLAENEAVAMVARRRSSWPLLRPGKNTRK